jgi:hypothetical protein
LLLIGVASQRKPRWARGRGRPLLPPKGNGATRVAMVSVSWADRSAIIERQREGVMLAFGSQEEEIR